MKALKTIGIIALIALLVAVVGAGGYFLSEYHNKDKNTAVTNAQSNTNNNASTAAPAQQLAPPKAATVTTCNADELIASIGQGDGGGAGTFNFTIVLTNAGSRTCTLGGFPGVSLVNDNGNQIGSPAERAKNYVDKTVTLKPKDSVKTIVSVENAGNFSDGVCKDGATKLRVYPPNDTGYLSVATTVKNWCPGFAISPVQ